MDALPPPTKFVPFPIVTHDRRSVLGVAIAFAILPIISVILRVIARRLARRALDASDYCIILACIFAVALECVSITAVFKSGVGYDHMMNIIIEYGMEPITDLLKLLIPLQFLWALSLSFSKISILLLYSAVFAVPFVIWTARGAIVFIAAWGIATILAGCFICTPFAMNWDQTIPGGKCGDQVLSFTVTGSLNLITDVMVLVLPLPYLAKLQMRLYKTLVLIAVFSVGLLTCVVSAIRINTLKSMDFTDLTYSMPPANIFSGLEPSVAVILACIPLLRPLLGRTKYSNDGTAGYASGSATPSKALELETGDGRLFQALADDSSQYRLRPRGPKHHAEVQTAKSTSRGSSDTDTDTPGGIVVESQWKVDSNRTWDGRSTPREIS
ncbi:integral membrane protein [Cercophora newfieldiana]|uniref:Integral membrane protein n=1 Tax=Cercophora newfieldiana TaxID=92897 RepID=A0AA39Y9N5_9PEZI|nr:integral membrane protein [Cercophora newfieldiana]